MTQAQYMTTQQLLDRHAALREQWRDAFADVECAEVPLNSLEFAALCTFRDQIGEQLQDVARELESRRFKLRHFDSVPAKEDS